METILIRRGRRIWMKPLPVGLNPFYIMETILMKTDSVTSWGTGFSLNPFYIMETILIQSSDLIKQAPGLNSLNPFYIMETILMLNRMIPLKVKKTGS